MVIYSKESEVTCHPLRNRRVEVALLAHANPGDTHGECVGLSRAFELAGRFGAIPIDRACLFFREMPNLTGESLCQRSRQIPRYVRCD